MNGFGMNNNMQNMLTNYMMNQGNMTNFLNQNNIYNNNNQITNLNMDNLINQYSNYLMNQNNMNNNMINQNNINNMMNNNNIMNVGNNLEMNNWNNNQESQNFQEIDEFLNLHFKKGRNSDLVIFCKNNELLSEVVKRYCHKSLQKREDLLFLFNCNILREDRTVQELNLLNDSKILVLDNKPMYGG